MKTKKKHGHLKPPPGYQPAKQVSLDDALKLAVAMHCANGLDDAEKVYGRILAVAPDHADALHFMGVLRHQRGRSDQALALIRRSLALNAGVPDWHNNLGNVLLETGHLDEAAAAYEEAVRLGPDRADIHNNLGVLRRAQGRVEDSEAAYRRAIELDPKYIDAHTNLGVLLQNLLRSQEALQALSKALEMKPLYGRTRQALGMAYYMLGRFDDAAQVYRDWLKDEPGNPEAVHHLAGCSGQAVPERATDSYVELVFDGFADSFDAKLAKLSYRAPQLIAQALPPLLGEPRGALDVLDAGCGTGLCGPLLAPYARRLVGVDLSARMLARAEPRQVYDALHKAELTAFIEAEAAGSLDLIASADTLCYFGDLGAVTRAAARALRPDGWLVFTVESIPAAEAQDFRLNPHGRYSHRAGYLHEVLTAAGLVVGGVEPAHLRIEADQPVEGFVVSARKAPAAAPN
ncbi:tetratricopeptide repeat protein [Variovorax sp. dw_308]|uniref:tetratricopeptide repeat protein n=1 Tax=Variovorax sp. dw_308 TaxID=2721546 RepID=UPI001C47369A|nr:tetratricopeptide repeat protein [Variovorax sp. dw_308]